MPRKKRTLKTRVFDTTVAAGLSAASAVFYHQTTEGAKAIDEAGAIVPNTLMNFLMALISIDYLRSCAEDKKHLKLVVSLAVSLLVCSAPTIISAHKAKSKSAFMSAFAPMATFSSGLILSLTALEVLYGFFMQTALPLARRTALSYKRDAAEKIALYKARDTTLRNLSILSKRLQVADISAFHFTEMNTEEQTLALAFSLIETIKNPVPATQPGLFKKSLTLVAQTGLSAAMLTGSIGYTYAVETALTEYLGADYPALMASLALFMMSCQLMLNIKAAFMLVTAAMQVMDTIASYRKLPNALSLGGSATFLLPLILGPLLACRSGLTAQRLYNNNIDRTIMPIQFPNLDVVIYWVTCAFNMVYVAKSLHRIKNAYISWKDQKADAFLELNENIADFIGKIEALDVSTLPEFLQSVGPTASRLIEADLFPGVVSEEGERRLLLNPA